MFNCNAQLAHVKRPGFVMQNSKLENMFKGHQGKVTCVSWTYDDLKLVSCAANGSLYEWNVATGTFKMYYIYNIK